MFCIKSNVITLESIEMYGLVTVWTSMDDWPYLVILLKYGSHDMRHTGFHRLTVVNGTPGFWGVTLSLFLVCFSIYTCIVFISLYHVYIVNLQSVVSKQLFYQAIIYNQLPTIS